MVRKIETTQLWNQTVGKQKTINVNENRRKTCDFEDFPLDPRGDWRCAAVFAVCGGIRGWVCVAAITVCGGIRGVWRYCRKNSNFFKISPRCVAAFAVCGGIHGVWRHSRCVAVFTVCGDNSNFFQNFIPGTTSDLGRTGGTRSHLVSSTSVVIP